MTFTLELLGDCAVLIHLGERLDVACNAQALALAAHVREAGLPGVIDVAPAYASVCVRYDPSAWADPAGAQTPAARFTDAVVALAEIAAPAAALISAVIEIPVCYGGEFGPDLADVGRSAQLDPRDVIARHAGAEYRVAMLGFAPGFPYLLGLHTSLHTARRGSPRTRVPAGSVAIGGAQTGIYPHELPGGWSIIGRTPLRLFDAERNPPALLAPGQNVRFRAIDAAEFAALSR